MAALRKGGTVADNVRVELVRNLGAVYNDAWENEALRDRLIAEPRTVLAEHGIELPATVKVEASLVGDVSEAELTLDEWDRMVNSGTVVLKTTASRPDGVTTTELSEEQLEGVAGGGDLSSCWFLCGL
jgi:hypothetical protein